MKSVRFDKKGDKYTIVAVLDNGQKVEREFPKQAIEAIMKVKRLTETGACEYLAVHHWSGQDGSPKAPPVPPPPPAPVLPPEDPEEEEEEDALGEILKDDKKKIDLDAMLYDDLIDFAREKNYFAQPGKQSRKTEDIKKWLRKHI